MATREFEELIAWKKGRILLQEIAKEIEKKPLCRDFGMCDQVRRASDSILANIAEGFERSHPGEFRQFLSIAKASCGELRSHLYSLHDFGYLPDPRFTELLNQCREVSRIIGGLRNAITRSIRAHGKKP